MSLPLASPGVPEDTPSDEQNATFPTRASRRSEALRSGHTRPLDGRPGERQSLRLEGAILPSADALPEHDDDARSVGSRGAMKRIHSHAASHCAASASGRSVRSRHGRRSSGASELTPDQMEGMRTKLMQMSSKIGNPRLMDSVLGGSGGRLDGTMTLGRRESGDDGLMQPRVRQTTADSDDAQSCRELALEDMDAAQLLKELQSQQEQMEQCVAMGQHLLMELETCKEDRNALEEERDELVEAITELEQEMEEVKLQCQEQQQEYQTLQQEHQKVVQQLRPMRNQLSQLQLAIEEQEEHRREEREQWQRREKDLVQQLEEQKEDLHWHEEQAHIAFEAAEKAKPDYEQLAGVISAFTTKATRKVYFQRLKDWRDDNKKRRHALAILLHNARTWAAWEVSTMTQVMRKFSVWSGANVRRKRHDRSVLEAAEAGQRAALVQGALRAIIAFITSAWRTVAHDAQHWYVVQKKNAKESRRARAQAVSEHSLASAAMQLEVSELAHRNDIHLQAFRAVSDGVGVVHWRALRRWFDLSIDLDAAQQKVARLELQRDGDVAALSDRAATFEQQGSSLRKKCDKLTGELQAASALCSAHERELQRLRAEAARLEQEREASAAQVTERDRELARLRAQMEVALTRAQRKTKVLREKEGLSPCLQQAMQLAEGLRAHAESTTAALASRRIIAARDSPSPYRQREEAA
eukprot:TRINITY_DN1975_c1_g1_i1.p1 TRINITY_DN1975_c1_g1~~TRINITY_DN1975_c1_g1_i1.p1  ORF type:complete len:731 (+),score=277.33 TRINITY_DN1975_c1_g1_i1:102-2195(+)